jgi:hypothetical protein
MSGRARRRAPAHLSGLAALLLATIGLQLSYSEPGLLFLGPVLLLFAALATGRYPAESLLLRVAGLARRRRRAPSRSAPRRSVDLARPRGGTLLALALAGRAPPL